MATLASSPALQDQLAVAQLALADAQALLRKFLPEAMISRLQAEPEASIADHYASASVLFADLAGFVRMAKALGAKRTVGLLDRLVRAFDAAATRHGVEKIKTIGDGYMAVAGVPTQQPDHAARIARVAIDMRAAVADLAQELGLPLAIRIGIASGPVMAGIIGTSRLAFDVWGDAVNLASRLEKTAASGEIVVSDATRACLLGQFRVVHRERVDIRGYGVEDIWTLAPRLT